MVSMIIHDLTQRLKATERVKQVWSFVFFVASCELIFFVYRMPLRHELVLDGFNDNSCSHTEAQSHREGETD
jgi:hypothetical protein